MNLDGYALPIKKLKGTEPVESLDLSGKKLGVASTIVIASLISVNGALTSINLSKNNLTNYGRDMTGITELAAALGVNGSLTVTNLLGNHLDAESAKMLSEVAKLKGISLCGIQRNQTTADFSQQSLKPPDAILLASDLLQAGATGGLTSIDLSGNQLCGVWTFDYTEHGTYTAEGIAAIAEALRVNGSLTVANLLGNQLDAESAKMLTKVAKQKGISLCGIQRDQTTADFRHKDLKPPDAILLASDLSQAIVTGALTSLNLSKNQLCGVDSNGWGTYTTGGITAIADALRVNGVLTSVELRGNKLGDEGWGAIFAAICGNKDSKIMSMDVSYENIGFAGGKLIAEALRTSVTSALTMVR